MTSRHFHRTGGDPSSTRATRPCTSSIGTAARRGLTLARLPKPHAPLGGRPVPDAPSQTPRPSRDALEPWHHHARAAMTPNPNDLEMQRNNAHRAASARPTSMVMSNHNSGNDHTVLRVSGNASDAASSGARNPEPLAIRRPEPPGKSIRSTELRQRRAPHRSSRRCTARPSRPSQAPPSTRCLASLPPLRRGNVHRGNRGGRKLVAGLGAQERVRFAGRRGRARPQGGRAQVGGFPGAVGRGAGRPRVPADRSVRHSAGIGWRGRVRRRAAEDEGVRRRERTVVSFVFSRLPKRRLLCKSRNLSGLPTSRGSSAPRAGAARCHTPPRAAASMTLTPTPNPGPQPGIPADVNYWPVARPNPDPDVLEQQREAQHRQRLAQLSSGAHPSRTSDRHEGATSGSALAAPTNVVPSTDHAVVAVSPAFTVTRGERRKPPPGAKPLPPYDPRASRPSPRLSSCSSWPASSRSRACSRTRGRVSRPPTTGGGRSRSRGGSRGTTSRPTSRWRRSLRPSREDETDHRTRGRATPTAEKEEDGRLEGIFDAYLRDERGVLTDGNIGGSSPEPSPRA